MRQDSMRQAARLPGASPPPNIGVTLQNPVDMALRGMARSHARSGYAGGTWRASRLVRLRAATGVRTANGEPCSRNGVRLRDDRQRQNAGHDGGVPAARAAGLLEMVAQRPRGVFDGVPVNRAVGMGMRHNMDLRMPMQRRMVVA